MEQLEVKFYDHVDDGLPDRWTCPLIQPKLMEEAGRRGGL